MRAFCPKGCHGGDVKMLHHIEHQERCCALTIGWMLEHLNALVGGAQRCAIGGFCRGKVLKTVTAARSTQAGLHIFGNRARIKSVSAFLGHALENFRLPGCSEELPKFRRCAADQIFVARGSLQSLRILRPIKGDFWSNRHARAGIMNGGR